MKTTNLGQDGGPPADPSVKKRDLSHWWAFAGGAFFVALILVAVWGVLTFWVYPQKAPLAGATVTGFDPIAARGQFGDMFGAANALFSGLAFTALIVSLAMQRKELALQRLELTLARTEYARQATALIEQSKTMEKQAQIELLAARIVGVGSVLQLWQATAHPSDLQAWTRTKSTSPSNGITMTMQELEALLQDAKRLQLP